MLSWFKINTLIDQADAYYDQKDYTASIEYCNKVLELEPNHSLAWNRKGLALKAQSNFKEAIESYTKAIELNPKESTNWYNKGLALKAMGRDEEAIDCYGKALKLGLNRDTNCLGDTYRDEGKYGKALDCYNKTIELTPKQPILWYQKSLALKALGRDEEAIDCYGKALKLGLNRDTNCLGDTYSDEGKYDEAAQCYSKILELNSADEFNWNKQGDAYSAQRKFTEALNCYDKAIAIIQKKEFWLIRIKTDDSSNELLAKQEALLEKRGELLEKLGKYTEAVKCYEDASAKKYCSGQFHLGCLYHFGLGVKQEYAETYRYYHQAAEQNYAPAQAGLGTLFERGLGTSKNYQIAFSWYNKANAQKHPWAWIGLALLNLRDIIKVEDNPTDKRLFLTKEPDSYKPGVFLDFINWNKLLADKNQVDACVWLGAIYEHGLLQEKPDSQLACNYYQKAGQQGDNYSKKKAEELGKKILGTQNIIASPAISSNLVDTSGSVQLSLNIPYEQIIFKNIIGSGSFGQVFKGAWRHTDIAIKRLHAMQLSEEVFNEFKQEATIMARLRSPFIIQLYGIVLDSMPYCIVMEHMANGSLYNYLHSTKAIDWPQRLQIAQNMACGLAYLHAEKILHRDLKSLNVLLNDRLQAKLADFGLSTLKIETSTSTRQESIGTLMWMAPELFQRHAKYTTACDIYSYGIILWELATRKLPFADAHDRSLIRKWVIKGEREEIPANCPKHFAALIEECWSGNALMRPSTSQVIEKLKDSTVISNLNQNNLNSLRQQLSLTDSYQNNVASASNQTINQSNYQSNLISNNLPQIDKPGLADQASNNSTLTFANYRGSFLSDEVSSKIQTKISKRKSWSH